MIRVFAISAVLSPERATSKQNEKNALLQLGRWLCQWTACCLSMRTWAQIHYTHMKSQAWWCMPIIPTAEEADRQNPKACYPARLTESASCLLKDSLSQKTRWRMKMTLSDLWPALKHAHVHGTHTPERTHTRSLCSLFWSLIVHLLL